MYRTIDDFNKIKFPVYKIPGEDWDVRDGVLFYGSKVLDDSNMPGKSLGIRRLQCGRKDLQPLRKAYLDLVALLSSKGRCFIDSNGVPFKYIRTKTCPLIHHQIRSIESKVTKSIIHLKDVRTPFTIPRPPYGDARYARVLHLHGVPWLLYDFTTYRGKDSFRRV